MILISLQLNADEIKIKSQIDKVTVFRNGAQIKRVATVNIKSGINVVVFTDLPAGFNENSIIVKGNPKLEINSVSYRNDFTRTFESNPNYMSLKRQYEDLMIKKENEEIVIETWKEEESLILSNKKIGGENSGLTQEQLVKVADLYRVRLLDVKQKILVSKRKIIDLDKEIKTIYSQMEESISKLGNQNTAEVVIIINSNSPGNEIFELSYIDNRASWITSFDFRLESLQKPLNLINKGKIRQYTGEDWINVNLALSTGNPQTNIQFPVINPWFLYYFENVYYGQIQTKSKAFPAQTRIEDNVRADFEENNAEVDVKENITFMEFSLPDKISIPSDNKEHEVKLKDYEIAAEYQYIAIPKLDKNVYLQANIIDWNQYNLSSGEVKLYFEGTFVGTSVLDANLLSDTLSISLGPDIAIACKREKLKDLKKTNFLSNKKQIQSGFEISLKNNKPQAIEVVLRDQIPLSTDSEMEIETDELSGGKLNKETGIVEWKLKLQPGEQVKKKFSYTVKIPKDKRINL